MGIVLAFITLLAIAAVAVYARSVYLDFGWDGLIWEITDAFKTPRGWFVAGAILILLTAAISVNRSPTVTGDLGGTEPFPGAHIASVEREFVS